MQFCEEISEFLEREVVEGKKNGKRICFLVLLVFLLL